MIEKLLTSVQFGLVMNIVVSWDLTPPRGWFSACGWCQFDWLELRAHNLLKPKESSVSSI